MLRYDSYNFDHDADCPTEGWLTKRQMSAVLGITEQHFDRRYRPIYSYAFYKDPDPPHEVSEGVEREDDGKLFFNARDIFCDMNDDGLFERKSGVRLHSIV